MMFRTNILAIVGGGQKPKFATNKVILWDDLRASQGVQGKVGELSFKTYVKAVRLTKDKVVVVVETRVYTYNFDDLSLIDTIDTCSNPQGLVALNPDPENPVLAVPDKDEGLVHVKFYETMTGMKINAHQMAISALCLNA